MMRSTLLLLNLLISSFATFMHFVLVLDEADFTIILMRILID